MDDAGGKGGCGFTHKGEQRCALLQPVLGAVPKALQRIQGWCGSRRWLAGLLGHVLGYHVHQLRKLRAQAVQRDLRAFAAQAQQQLVQHPGPGRVQRLDLGSIGHDFRIGR